MVLQVGSDGGEVLLDLDTGSLEYVCWADTAELENVGVNTEPAAMITSRFAYTWDEELLARSVNETPLAVRLSRRTSVTETPVMSLRLPRLLTES